MIRNKIAFKLTIGFVVIVLISMLTIGLFFIHMFRQYTIENQQKTLFEKAQSISQVISENSLSDGQMRGFGGLMLFLDTITESTVWITDSSGEPAIMTGMGMSMGMGGHLFSSDPVPAEFVDVISNALSNKEAILQSYSSIYNDNALTIGVPIIQSNGNVIGSVLLHAPKTGITGTYSKAITFLIISIIGALMLSIGLGIFYSILFTRPLKSMNRAAIEMAKGNYSVQTGLKSQDELGQLSTSLDLLAGKLYYTISEITRLEQLRKDFVANVSHEFKTPLTVIKGSLEALSDGTVNTPETIALFYTRMLSEVKSLERLVWDLLELSRLQSGKITINKEIVNIENLIMDAVRSMQTIADNKNIKINLSSPNNLPPIVGDYDKLRQLFIIFIDNAVKYSPESTIISIMINFSSKLQIIISDQGYGISKQDLPYVWDRFYKTDKSRTSTGTGLGLAIAKHLIQLHDGDVLLESDIGKGTTVIITLPTSQN